MQKFADCRRSPNFGFQMRIETESQLITIKSSDFWSSRDDRGDNRKRQLNVAIFLSKKKVCWLQRQQQQRRRQSLQQRTKKSARRRQRRRRRRASALKSERAHKKWRETEEERSPLAKVRVRAPRGVGWSPFESFQLAKARAYAIKTVQIVESSGRRANRRRAIGKPRRTSVFASIRRCSFRRSSTTNSKETNFDVKKSLATEKSASALLAHIKKRNKKTLAYFRTARVQLFYTLAGRIIAEISRHLVHRFESDNKRRDHRGGRRHAKWELRRATGERESATLLVAQSSRFCRRKCSRATSTRHRCRRHARDLST